MSDTVISAENLGKSYLVGHRVLRKDASLREMLARRGREFGKKTLDLLKGRQVVQGDEIEEFWALRDVSFEVSRGEVVGIVGRNGAGKSTLLKILSRITEPTEGRVRIRGRVASLLEVGTGFHPELTGRENVYLNGTILGMTRSEIQRKFDEIVAFAEIEQFIDTPVKRYSSGMYVRLAFAVAAHLESEILIIDEVLSVGDADFQRKCLGKVGDATRSGRTVLFVSHSMAAIGALCQKGIFLQNGRIQRAGDIRTVVDAYVWANRQKLQTSLADRSDRKGNGCLKVDSVSFRLRDGTATSEVRSGDDVIISIGYHCAPQRPIKNVHFAIGVLGRLDENLFHLSTTVSGGDLAEVSPTGYVNCCIEKIPLQPGTYVLDIFCRVSSEISDWIQGAAELVVTEGNFFDTGKLPPNTHGSVLVQHHWTNESRDHGG